MRRSAVCSSLSLLALSAVTAASMSACTPMDATVNGTYASYFAVNSSENLYRLRSKLVDFSKQATLDKYKFTPVDCRPPFVAANYNSNGKLTSCADNITDRLAGTDYGTECGTGTFPTCASDGTVTDQGSFVPFQRSYFPWITEYSYYVRSENVKPWRVEAVITTEGDLQLTMHNDVGNVGDFRFGFVVKPSFQPTQCVDNPDGSGGAVSEPVDGDWLTNWSVDENGGTLIHLNAYSYQLNPSNTDPQYAWYFPQSWMAGYAFGRMADEDLYGHGIDYLDPISDTDNTADCDFDNGDCGSGYNPPLYMDQSNPNGSTGYNDYHGHWGQSANYADFVSSIRDQVTYSDTNPSDLASMGKVTTDQFAVDLKVEDNTWRADNAAAVAGTDSSDGFAGWVGVDPSWVTFEDSPSDLAKRTTGNQDKPLKGHFHMFLESASAASKVLVEGDFAIDHIAKDVWGYSPTLQQRKTDENNTPTCGEERMTFDSGTSGS